MCEYCRRRIHASGCPEAEEVREVCRCDYCKDGIEQAEPYVALLEKVFHRACFFDHIFSMHEDEFLDVFELDTGFAGEA